MVILTGMAITEVFAQTEADEAALLDSFVKKHGLGFTSDNVPFYTGREIESVTPAIGRKRFKRIVEEHLFENDTEGWSGINRIKAHIEYGMLVIEADQQQPSLYRSFNVPEGAEIRVQLRIRTTTSSDCVFYWQTSVSPRQSNDKMARVSLINDGQWHDYEVELPVRGNLTNLTLSLTASEGRWEVDHFRLYADELHPLMVVKVTSIGENIEYTVRNQGPKSISFEYAGTNYTLGSDKEIPLTVTPVVRDCLHVFALRLVPENYPAVEYSAFRYRPELESRWYVLPLGTYRLYIAESGSMARIQSGNGEPFAIIAPIMHDESHIPEFVSETSLPLLTQSELNDAKALGIAYQAARANDNALTFASPETQIVIRTVGTEIHLEIKNRQHFEGPVVRAIGNLRGGLLSGCELLDGNNVSNSEIDINPVYVNRFEPPSVWLTMPLMAIAVQTPEKLGEYESTVDQLIALSWDDTGTQPTFAVPNDLDVVNDMRMSLRADEKIHATIYLCEGGISDAVLWYLRQNALPDVPELPRSAEEQKALTLAAFRGPLLGSDGMSWGYCAEPEWPRQPYDSVASTIWSLSGQLPTLADTRVSGGSAIPNETYYFLSGQALDLVDMQRERNERIIAEMRADNSFLFPTRFPDFELNEPSAGYCARRTLDMIAYARLTGDRRTFQHVARSIEYMKRFHTPRGGYYWESPQHTPDLLTAAHMVLLHVWAYEFSGDDRYIERARYWALMGVPFVYLRDQAPHMLYATVPMYGASEREKPVWFGTSQPWCGCVYAYAITMLSPYDQTVDWRKIARGILHHAESVQFANGPYIGCLPDGFSLDTQQAVSWKVNPAVIASLRQLLDHSYHSYVVVHDRNIWVASPFPVKLTRDGVIVEGSPEGLNYQILINGSQVLDIFGGKTHRDFVPLK